MRPRILQSDGQVGFQWATPDGQPTSLQSLVVDDDEPDRLVATHLAALDDALIIAAERFGELLGGARRPTGEEERDGLLELHRVLDRLSHEFAIALKLTGLNADVRAGQIVGTATLFSIRARQPLDLLGPAPLDGELDEPEMGVVGGFGEMVQVDPSKPWRGGRWVVRTEAGRRIPLTLSTLLFDSSGTNKDAARREHREALLSVMTAAESADADPFAVACALDWLLYDFLMAHRDGPDSAAVVIPKGQEGDAALVVAATAASVAARATFDPGLVGLGSPP
ncbi:MULTISPECIES: hypothetical protein [Pseudonocardia]|uniref:Uncharacterized protein n=2 Tax=Pseudonocardia TaxID=1847 RepID=A0A1Y2MHR6_PSEAH|nr:MULTISPECIES: hypothetical protein [Pseudonocardia]OSY34702.1 hypothetical protein BG845_06590 [Pseudonocardia autotrophica]TDN76398.1 hypothetical protein C8E95_5596 [Pseudonocardia autotrophica]BBG00388.1 hypothetical protein Pdca_15970 [Pseudonocardia autotrophica]GEC28431.1 hypothetical protein PSA01_54600 [Pseudonocardia saturnea]